MKELLLDPWTIGTLYVIVLALLVDYIRDHRRQDNGAMFDSATVIKAFRIAEGRE